MLLLISDANILIDMEEAGLTATIFRLDFSYIVPDVLFVEELEEQHPHLLELGLQTAGLGPKLIQRVEQLVTQYPKPSRLDIMCLVLAEAERCPLLTGDGDLRAAATSENVVVKGTIWLMEELVKSGLLSVAEARGAFYGNEGCRTTLALGCGREAAQSA